MALDCNTIKIPAMDMYFSEREIGTRPRIEEQIDEVTWGGIRALIDRRISDGSFGARFPRECQDEDGVIGTDGWMMGQAFKAEVQGIGWPIPATAPSTLAILDLLEFCHRNVASPIQGFYHQFFGHYHFTFDLEEGQEEFRSDVNRILRRNGIAYKLSQNGKIARILSPVLQELVTPALPTTGDSDLDEMLKLAITRFLDPDLQVRRESLEKLWKAFERLKTIIPGKDKKQSADAILDKAASEPALRDALANEARELTRIGNTFQIRHGETNQIRLNEGKHVDYLFHRLFSFIQLLLNSIR